MQPLFSRVTYDLLFSYMRGGNSVLFGIFAMVLRIVFHSIRRLTFALYSFA